MIRALALILFAAPALAEGANPPSITSWLLSSLMVIGLILVLGFLLKKSKLTQVMGGGQMKVIATLPLTTNETWQQLAVNELVMFEGGDIVRRDVPAHPVYMSAEEGLAIARAAGVSV